MIAIFLQELLDEVSEIKPEKDPKLKALVRELTSVAATSQE